MFNIEFVPVVEDEMSDAYYWYEGQSPGLGDKLYKEINHYLSIIERNPLYFLIRYTDDVRCAVLKKFPYLTIYWIDNAKNDVVILSIFHTSRKPKQF